MVFETTEDEYPDDDVAADFGLSDVDAKRRTILPSESTYAFPPTLEQELKKMFPND